ncbi:hypothetical protein C0Q70_05304 [Pomacea canaliculata]|uniref:Uncharacterized protein n=1 Tax=Pomacea canaliculata TaxID=400727 RepID=A0A2T7PKW8_POMCA|nr:hypothetical protein C0Q70_05304 [Pomacea canaliculata]
MSSFSSRRWQPIHLTTHFSLRLLLERRRYSAGERLQSSYNGRPRREDRYSTVCRRQLRWVHTARCCSAHAGTSARATLFESRSI